MERIKIKKQPAWKTQLHVIDALFRREISTRFGAYKLGLMWLILEPLISVIMLGLILKPILGRANDFDGIPYAFFILCGFMILKILTGPMSIAAGAITSNQGLLVFRQVQPIDTFISRFLFELISTLTAFGLFCIVAVYFGVELSFHHALLLLNCFLISWCIGCGLGLSIGINALKFREIEKVTLFMQRPLLFSSCILYSLSSMPPNIQQILLYNPIVHTAEVSRMALFPTYQVDNVNLIYPMFWAIGCLAYGLVTYNNNRHFLAQR